eukprot:1674439-Rhodomonas_salina.4
MTSAMTCLHRRRRQCHITSRSSSVVCCVTVQSVTCVGRSGVITGQHQATASPSSKVQPTTNLNTPCPSCNHPAHAPQKCA